MTIPSQAEAKAASIAKEISPFEEVLKDYLELPSTVAYLDGDALDKTIIRVFIGDVLTDEGVDALKTSITAAGWTEATVENQFTPAAVGLGINQGHKKPELFVSFKPAASVTPPPSGE